MKRPLIVLLTVVGRLASAALVTSSAADSSANILRGPGPTGGGDLLASARVADGILGVPGADTGHPGYLCFRHAPVDLGVRPVLVLEVATSGGAIYVESKTAADEMVTDAKVLLEFPDTGGQYARFAADLAPLLPRPLTVPVLVLSDPCGRGLRIRSITYEVQAADATLLQFDGRRYSALIPDAPLTLPFPDLHRQVNLYPGGGISYTYTNSVLRLRPSSGWLWGYLPTRIGGTSASTGLDQNPYLTIAYRSVGRASVFVELKNANGQALVGSPANGVAKLAIDFPRARADSIQMGFVTIDLRPELLMRVQNRAARIIAFSDPSGAELEILGYGLTAAKPRQGDVLPGTPD